MKLGRLIKSGSFMHSYPFCWRSDTPLIYRAVPSWFVAVENLKVELLENNKQTYWVPDFVKEKRFHNWLENARDWAVSRTRFWGTPLPVWISEDGEEIIVMDSVEKLEMLSGVKVICEAKLCEEVNADTVATTLALAEQHGCSQLKAICLKFAANATHLGGRLKS